MNAERVARLVSRWVRLYTRGLPSPIAERRLEEIEADVDDHVAHERCREIASWRITLGVLSRLARGVPADTSWRRSQARMHGERSWYRSVRRMTIATGLILMVPLVAMQFTGEVLWTAFDFAVAAVFLGGAGLIYQLIASRRCTTAYRVAVGTALAAAFFVIWVNLAVGAIGEPQDPANLMYIGVLVVGLIGAWMARFRSNGMARAMIAMALALALVAIFALIAGKHQLPASSLTEVLAVNAMFAVLFLVSAWLFQRAERARGSVAD